MEKYCYIYFIALLHSTGSFCAEGRHPSSAQLALSTLTREVSQPSAIPLREKSGMYNLMCPEHVQAFVEGIDPVTGKKFSLKAGDTVMTIGTHELYEGHNRHYSIWGEKDNVMIVPSVKYPRMNLCFLKRGPASVHCYSFDYVQDPETGKKVFKNKKTEKKTITIL